MKSSKNIVNKMTTKTHSLLLGVGTLALGAALIITLIVCSGCSALAKSHPLLDAVPEVVTNTVTRVVTNEVVKVVAGQPVTNIVIQTEQIPVLVTNTVYVPSKTVGTIENTGGMVADFLPAPFSGIAKTALGLFGAAVGLYGSLMSRKYKSVVRAIASGVEVANNDDVKAIIQGHATAAGVQHLLDPIVQEVSKNLPQPAQAPSIFPGK